MVSCLESSHSGAKLHGEAFGLGDVQSEAKVKTFQERLPITVPGWLNPQFAERCRKYVLECNVGSSDHQLSFSSLNKTIYTKHRNMIGQSDPTCNAFKMENDPEPSRIGNEQSKSTSSLSL